MSYVSGKWGRGALLRSAKCPSKPSFTVSLASVKPYKTQEQENPKAMSVSKNNKKYKFMGKASVTPHTKNIPIVSDYKANRRMGLRGGGARRTELGPRVAGSWRVRPTCRPPARPAPRGCAPRDCAPRPARAEGRAAGPLALTARSGWPLSRWDTARMTPARQPLPQPLCPRSGRASSPAATHRNRFPTSSGRVSTAMAASAPGTSAARSYRPPMLRSRPQARRPASESAPARSATRSRAAPVLPRAPQAN